MVFPADHPLFPGLPKGMFHIVKERGLLPDRPRCSGICQQCKSNTVKDPNVLDCCLTRILSMEPDFLAERSALEELFLKRGHLCQFLPKFHCELNPIEMVWGRSKFLCREECDYSFPKLKERVPRILDGIPVTMIRKWFRLAQRFGHVYQQGLTGRMAAFACKKYTSHRRIPEAVLNDLKEKWAQRLSEQN